MFKKEKIYSINVINIHIPDLFIYLYSYEIQFHNDIMLVAKNEISCVLSIVNLFLMYLLNLSPFEIIEFSIIGYQDNLKFSCNDLI